MTPLMSGNVSSTPPSRLLGITPNRTTKNTSARATIQMKRRHSRRLVVGSNAVGSKRYDRVSSGSAVNIGSPPRAFGLAPAENLYRDRDKYVTGLSSLPA